MHHAKTRAICSLDAEVKGRRAQILQGEKEADFAHLRQRKLRQRGGVMRLGGAWMR